MSVVQMNSIKIAQVQINFTTGTTGVTVANANAMTLSVSEGSLDNSYSINIVRTPSGSWPNRTYNFSGSIMNLVFTDCDENQEVTFSLTYTSGWNTNTKTAKTTIKELKDGTETLDFGF